MGSKSLTFIQLIVVTVALAMPPVLADSVQRPNILFFLVDDMGIGDTSVPFLYRNGKPQRTPLNDLYRTPNMEKLAASGRLFTNAYFVFRVLTDTYQPDDGPGCSTAPGYYLDTSERVLD